MLPRLRSRLLIYCTYLNLHHNCNFPFPGQSPSSAACFSNLSLSRSTMTWAVFQYAMVWLHPWLFLLEAIFGTLHPRSNRKFADVHICSWAYYHLGSCCTPTQVSGCLQIFQMAGRYVCYVHGACWYGYLLSLALFWRRDGLPPTYHLGPGVAQSMDNSPLPLLVRHAQGVVVDIGPGSGEQLHRYDVSKITRIYGIEPNTRLFPALRENIKKAGLEEIYTIVPCGVEHKETLKEHGIEENSIDSVLTIHVLCSVPNPKETVAALYEYLKPGGQFIYFEHVKSTRFLARLTQGCPILHDKPVLSADVTT